jgi:LPXTG-motif cell wall-anchored protein
LLLIIAPTIYPQTASLGILAFIVGLIVGGLGFYLRFIKKQRPN